MPKFKDKFKETLPKDCPPEEKVSIFSKQPVLRLVTSATPTAQDFLSYAALGITPRGDADPCMQCACSVFTLSEKVDRAAQLKKLPKLRNRKHVARLTLTPASGVGLLNKESGHISWWIYHSFDPVGAIEQVVSLP
jgi:hypothetical protein